MRTEDIFHNESKKNASRFFDYTLIVFLLTLSFASLYYVYSKYSNLSSKNAIKKPDTNIYSASDLADFNSKKLLDRIKYGARDGNWAAAAQAFEELSKKKKEINKQDYVKAFFTASSVLFKDNGNLELKTLEKIFDSYKSIIFDKDINAYTRAEVANALATSYCGAGRDERVLDKLYEGEQFSKFYIKGDPGKSSMLMLKWSYDIYPTARAAIGISHWYVKELLSSNKAFTKKQKKEYIDEAIKWLKISEELAQKERLLQKRKKQSGAYVFWRAYTIGALAELKVEPYTKVWKQEFDKAIRYIEDSNDIIIINGFANSAYLFYAYYAHVIDSDKELAKQNLQKIVNYRKTSGDRNPEIFELFAYNANKRVKGDHVWLALRTMQDKYPFFDNYVKTVIKRVEKIR